MRKKAAMLPIAAAVVMTLSAWTGPPPAAPDSRQYRLSVAAPPGRRIELQAKNVTNGWIAAFCTVSTCEPFHASITIPKSGRSVVRFDMIRTGQHAPFTANALVTDGTNATVVNVSLRR